MFVECTMCDNGLVKLEPHTPEDPVCWKCWEKIMKETSHESHQV